MRKPVVVALANMLTMSLMALGLLLPLPAHAEPSREELLEQIRQQTIELEMTIEQFNELREDLDVTSAQTDVIRRQIEPIEHEILARQATVGHIAAAGYRQQRAATLQVLFKVRTSREVVDQLLFVRAFQRVQQRQIDELELARERFATVQRTLTSLVQQQQEQQETLAAKRVRIELAIVELEELRSQAPRTPRPLDNFTPARVEGLAGRVVEYAMNQLGSPYRWAGSNPSGFDCSGLVKAAYGTAGLTLPHNARRQQEQTIQITQAALKPGDLVFYYPDLHHVGIYIGGNRIVHAPEFGSLVRIDPVDSLPIHSFGTLIPRS